MSEHFQAVVDHVMGNDDSELGKTKAELSYALFSLEREIAICHQTQEKLNEAVRLLDALLGLEKGSGQAALAFVERHNGVVGGSAKP